jgi:transposase
MHLPLKRLLNHVERLEGFVYESSALNSGSIEIRLRPDQRKLGKCSRCREPAPGYDRLQERRFQFVPLWGLMVYFIYAPRRLECHRCGIHVEYLPWALGKRPVTMSLRGSWRVGPSC